MSTSKPHMCKRGLIKNDVHITYITVQLHAVDPMIIDCVLHEIVLSFSYWDAALIDCVLQDCVAFYHSAMYVRHKVRIRTILGFSCANFGS